MEKVHIDVKGMTCSKCQDKVQTALDALPDVRSVVVKWEQGTAELLVNKGSNHKELEEAVERAGFTVPSIKCECKG
jgi:copper chaperone